MPLEPLSTWRHFSEQRQAAVISVQADRTAFVDLFISLQAAPGGPKEMRFLLPLQTLPKEFHAEELEAERFAHQHMDPLEGILRTARTREHEARDAVSNSYQMGAFLAGPCAVGAMLLTREQYVSMSAATMAPAPALSVATQHTTADIYPSLRPAEVAALAKTPDLPREVRDTLARYAGRPFALVRMRFLPAPAPGPSGTDGGPSSAEPGVHFSFPQELRPTRAGKGDQYAFPLGTGSAWATPVANTMVYVTGPERLNLAVDFPEPVGDNLTGEDWARSSTTSGVARGRQVHSASYGGRFGGNPPQDVAIILRPAGTSPLVARRDSLERRKLACQIVLPLLGVLAWLVSFRLLVSPRRAGSKKQWWGALGLGWLAAQGLLLAPLWWGAAYWQSSLWRHDLESWLDHSWVAFLIEGDLWREQFLPAVTALAPLVLLGLVWALTLVVVAPRFKATATIWRMLLNSALAAAIYLGAGSLVVRLVQ